MAFQTQLGGRSAELAIAKSVSYCHVMLRFFSYLLFVLSVSSGAQQQQIVKVEFPNFPPSSYVNDDGHIVGDLVDNMRKAVVDSGFIFQPSIVPTKRAFYKINRGDTDILLCACPDTLSASYPDVSFSGIPLGSIDLYAYRLQKKAPVANKNDLLKHTLGLHQGYTYGGLMAWLMGQNPAPKHIFINATKQGFRLLAAGRIDYFLEYKVIADELGVGGQYASSLISSINTYMVFAGRHKNTALKKNIESAMQRIVGTAAISSP